MKYVYRATVEHTSRGGGGRRGSSRPQLLLFVAALVGMISLEGEKTTGRLCQRAFVNHVSKKSSDASFLQVFSQLSLKMANATHRQWNVFVFAPAVQWPSCGLRIINARDSHTAQQFDCSFSVHGTRASYQVTLPHSIISCD